MGSSQDAIGTLGGIILGVLGGIALAAIIDALIGTRCPVCGGRIEEGVPVCPHCHSALEWR